MTKKRERRNVAEKTAETKPRNPRADTADIYPPIHPAPNHRCYIRPHLRECKPLEQGHLARRRSSREPRRHLQFPVGATRPAEPPGTYSPTDAPNWNVRKSALEMTGSM
jgi:hypothetical protein